MRCATRLRPSHSPVPSLPSPTMVSSVCSLVSSSSAASFFFFLSPLGLSFARSGSFYLPASAYFSYTLLFSVFVSFDLFSEKCHPRGPAEPTCLRRDVRARSLTAALSPRSTPCLLLPLLLSVVAAAAALKNAVALPLPQPSAAGCTSVLRTSRSLTEPPCPGSLLPSAAATATTTHPLTVTLLAADTLPAGPAALLAAATRPTASSTLPAATSRLAAVTLPAIAAAPAAVSRPAAAPLPAAASALPAATRPGAAALPAAATPPEAATRSAAANVPPAAMLLTLPALLDASTLPGVAAATAFARPPSPVASAGADGAAAAPVRLLFEALASRLVSATSASSLNLSLLSLPSLLTATSLSSLPSSRLRFATSHTPYVDTERVSSRLGSPPPRQQKGVTLLYKQHRQQLSRLSPAFLGDHFPYSAVAATPVALSASPPPSSCASSSSSSCYSAFPPPPRAVLLRLRHVGVVSWSSGGPASAATAAGDAGASLHYLSAAAAPAVSAFLIRGAAAVYSPRPTDSSSSSRCKGSATEALLPSFLPSATVPGVSDRETTASATAAARVKTAAAAAQPLGTAAPTRAAAPPGDTRATEERRDGIELLLSKPRGFCAGVSRAIGIVEEALRIWGPPVYVRHSIVHNEVVCQDLRRKGAIFVEEIEDIPQGAVAVFSAHGVSPAVRAAAAARQLRVVDATCPLVSKVHVYVRQQVAAGYHIILIGHRNHVEVEGTSGEAPPAGLTVAETVEDVERLSFPADTKLYYVTQTTLSLDDCAAIREALLRRFPNIKTIPSGSICYATTNRQQALRALVLRTDLTIVVGSTTSSNAQRLLEVATRRGRRAYLVNDPAEIKREWLDGVKQISLSSSASTPEATTAAVIKRLQEYGVTNISEVEVVHEREPFWKFPQNLRQAAKEVAGRAAQTEGEKATKIAAGK